MWTNQDLKKLRPKNNFKNSSKQYPASNFTPCHDQNIFSHSKTIQLLSLKTIFFILPGIRNRPFATRILSFTAMAGSTTCGRHLVFARLILKNSLLKRFASARTWEVHEIYPYPGLLNSVRGDRKNMHFNTIRLEA